jgi:hypothetical protein
MSEEKKTETTTNNPPPPPDQNKDPGFSVKSIDPSKIKVK